MAATIVSQRPERNVSRLKKHKNILNNWDLAMFEVPAKLSGKMQCHRDVFATDLESWDNEPIYKSLEPGRRIQDVALRAALPH